VGFHLDCSLIRRSFDSRGRKLEVIESDEYRTAVGNRTRGYQL
jgi:hypothetical protein